MSKTCTHLNQIKIRETDKHVCEECVKTGDSWVHLRLCLNLWACGLLRFVEEQACHQTFPPHTAPSDPFQRARRVLDLVLRGRNRAR